MTMERKRVEEFVESLRLRLWMNQSCISLGFLSQNSLWKLSQYGGYKGIYIVGWEGNAKRQFLPNRAFWRLNLATGLSREFKPRANGLISLGLLSCSATAGATLQLLACLARVRTFGDLQAATYPQDLVARLCFSCTLLSFSSPLLTHYPYNIPT